jgi:multiple sugar transport system substrate-binding protein
MEEIVFSVFQHGPRSIENLQTLLQKFEQQHKIRVRLDIVPSSARWSRLVEMALYRSGPDISEVGSTWVGDLVRMEALRPFNREEINEITERTRFFDAVWQSSIRTDHGTSKVYSIPLSADARVIFYRRDLLEKAEVAFATAFADFACFEKTLANLKEKGISMPLALPTRRSSMTLHYIASWVWGAGGDFLSPDGTSPAFDQPRALEGFKAYYRLMKYLAPEARNLEEEEADNAFGNGRAAVLPSGFWIPTNNIIAEVRKNMSAALMPGIPFVGGSNLVIWNHSRQQLAAIKLIQFLHTEEAAKLLYPWFGLPINESGWSTPPFDSEIYQVFKASIQKGRGFPTVQLWGLVEKRLTDVLTDIWGEVLREPEQRLDAIVETHLNNLGRRLQLSLGSE